MKRAGLNASLSAMTTNDEEAELAQFKELLRDVPLHMLMDLRCLEHGPHTVVTMELSDSVRGPVPGTGSGGDARHSG